MLTPSTGTDTPSTQTQALRYSDTAALRTRTPSTGPCLCASAFGFIAYVRRASAFNTPRLVCSMLAPSTGGATTPPGTRHPYKAAYALDSPLLAHQGGLRTRQGLIRVCGPLTGACRGLPARFGFIACTRPHCFSLPTHTQGGDPGILHPPKVKVKDPKSETDNTLDPSTTPY